MFMGLFGKLLKVAGSGSLENAVLNETENTVVANVDGTTQSFAITRSQGVHHKILGDACLFTFMSDGAKQSISISIANFSKITGPVTLQFKSRSDGVVMHSPDMRAEPVLNYASTSVKMIITAIDRVQNKISGTFEASGFDVTENMADYEPSTKVKTIRGNFHKCGFRSL
jgi:hypothetical protein